MSEDQQATIKQVHYWMDRATRAEEAFVEAKYKIEELENAAQPAAPVAANDTLRAAILALQSVYQDEPGDDYANGYAAGHRDARHAAAKLVSAAASGAAPVAATEQATWAGAAEWLRNNYQAHDNIASLCDAMQAAAPLATPADAGVGLMDCDAAFNNWYAAQSHQLTNEQVCRLIWQRGWQACARISTSAAPVTAEPVAWAFADGLERLARVRDGHQDSPLLVVYATEVGDYKVPLFTAQPAAQVPSIDRGWISVDERLPEGECIAVYVTPNGKSRLIRAKYTRQFQHEAEGDDCATEYNEEDDTFYIKAGWLECIDNWGEYSSCYVVEGTVTHWMPLPDAPIAAAHAAHDQKGGWK